MAYCVKCGAKVEDHVRYCQQCGAEIPIQGQNNHSEYTYNQGQADGYRYQSQNRQERQVYNTYGQSSAQYFDRDDVQRNKLMGILSYLGILVLIPILAGNKNSEYVKFHTNQGLVLFVISVILNLLSGGWVFGFHSFINFGNIGLSWVFNLLDVVVLLFVVVGIVYACRGDRRELPFVGRIKIFR